MIGKGNISAGVASQLVNEDAGVQGDPPVAPQNSLRTGCYSQLSAFLPQIIVGIAGSATAPE